MKEARSKPRVFWLKPLSVWIYSTWRCNLRCKHCVAEAGDRFPQELSYEELQKVLKEIGRWSVAVKLSGGEPFIREDLIKIIKYLGERRLFISIETNGMLLTKYIIRLLRKLETQVSISLDGACPGTHDAIRGVQGAYEKAIESIKIAVREGLRVQVITVLMPYNYHEVLDIAKLVLDKFQVHDFRILPVSYSGRAKDIERFTVKEKKECFDLIFKIMRRYPAQVSTGIPIALMPIDLVDSSRLFTCDWGRSMCAILPNGDVSYCGYVHDNEFIAGNVKQESLIEIFNIAPLFKKLRSIKAEDLKGVCGNCLAVEKCRGSCRQYAYEVYSDFLAPYPTCQEFYNGGLFPSYALIDPSKDSSY